jgi:serine/threonine protein kinase
MEYVPNGNLRDYLASQQEISWETRYQIARDISIGLNHLHEGNILHRDLKSYNVVLDAQFNAKLCDFGFATIKDEGARSESSGVKGTPQWMAPELFDTEQKDYRPTKESDIYSLGMVLWEIATREMPYGKKAPMLVIATVLKGELAWKKLSDDCPQAFAALIKACCDETPSKRPDAKEVVSKLDVMWREEQEKNTQTKESKKPNNSTSSSSSSNSSKTPASGIDSVVMMNHSGGFGIPASKQFPAGGIVPSEVSVGLVSSSYSALHPKPTHPTASHTTTFSPSSSSHEAEVPRSNNVAHY